LICVEKISVGNINEIMTKSLFLQVKTKRPLAISLWLLANGKSLIAESCSNLDFNNQQSKHGKHLEPRKQPFIIGYHCHEPKES
jgi:hypothetical protein